MSKRRSQQELWRALRALDDPLDAGTPIGAIDRGLAEAGADAEALARQGRDFAAELAEQRRLGWQANWP